MLAPKNVLMCGCDSHVSYRRKVLLESDTYNVHVAGNADQALQHLMNRPSQILILCQTIPFESAENLLSVARTLNPW
jgi:DNA-binding response OmpR family regulator